MVTTSTVVPPESRPEPIRDALARVAFYLGTAVAVVVFLGSKGVLSTAQVELVTGYATLLNSWIENVASIVAAVLAGGSVLGGIKLAARHATGWSTPSSDPRDVDGVPLMRVDGKPLGGVEPPPVALPAYGTDDPPSTEQMPSTNYQG